MRSRCLHPGQQQGRRWPSSSSSWVRRMRRSRVVCRLASSTQQMNSLRAKGVMSFQASSAEALAISALRRSVGNSCDHPTGHSLDAHEPIVRGAAHGASASALLIRLRSPVSSGVADGLRAEAFGLRILSRSPLSGGQERAVLQASSRRLRLSDATGRRARCSARIRSRLTYANIMSTVGVFIALGGVSYAAMTLPKNSVGPAQVKSNAVSSSKVRNGSLGGWDVKNGSLRGGDGDVARRRREGRVADGKGLRRVGSGRAGTRRCARARRRAGTQGRHGGEGRRWSLRCHGRGRAAQGIRFACSRSRSGTTSRCVCPASVPPAAAAGSTAMAATRSSSRAIPSKTRSDSAPRRRHARRVASLHQERERHGVRLHHLRCLRSPLTW